MSRNSHQTPDSHTKIRSWDDGFEYIKPRSDHISGERPTAPVDSFQPSPGTSRQSRYGPTSFQKPPVAAPRDAYNRAHRSRHGRSPSPLLGSARSRTPLRKHRGEPSLKNTDARHAEGSASIPRGRGDRPMTGTFQPNKPPHRRTSSPPPSAPPGRRAYSPSPSRHRGTSTQFSSRDTHRDRRPPASYRPQSPSSPVGHRPARRPDIQRSKTTSVREAKADHDRGIEGHWDKNGKRSSLTNQPPLSSTEGRARPHPVSEAVSASETRPAMKRSRTTSVKDKALSPRWQKLAIAALQAGGAAAINARSQPGAWKGEKGARVATAVLGAVALDALNKGGARDTVPKESERRRGDDNTTLGGAIGGMLAERLTAAKKSNGR